MCYLNMYSNAEMETTTRKYYFVSTKYANTYKYTICKK